MTKSSFSAYTVRKSSDGEVQSGMEVHSMETLPAGDVLVGVHYSSLNYKDAMAATANPAIAKSLPHVPGIDAAGVVVQSADGRFEPGTSVIVTGHELGVERWGGWSEYVQIPGDWVVPLPQGLSLEESMVLGTAGFTAAQCVQALERQKVKPGDGPIVVTGASGGVGSLSIMMLSQLGYHVIAVTGKLEQTEWLKSLGAKDVIDRISLSEPGPRPLLGAKYAGAVDTVGGKILSYLCKVIHHRGAIACCGLTAGPELELTVYPFILRGLTLCGVDSAWCPEPERAAIWNRLADEWKLRQFSDVKRIISLSEISKEVAAMLEGKSLGRVVIEMAR
jgi:acrylyl-CoA reductase (NADPH)